MSEEARIGAEIDRPGKRSTDPFASAVRATRMPMIITDPHRPDNPIVFLNDAFTKLTGYSREEIIGRNCRFLQGPLTDSDDVGKIRDAIKRREPIEIDLLNYKKNGDTFWNRVLIAPVSNEEGQLTHFFASQFDVTLQRDHVRDLNAAVENRERVLNALIKSSSEVRYRLNADWSSLQQLTGGNFIADSTSNDNWFEEYVPPGSRAAVRAEIARAIDTKTNFDLDHEVYLLNGAIGWASSRAVPLFDQHGDITEWYGTASNITIRKHAEGELRDLNDSLEQRVTDAVAERGHVEDQLRQSQKMEAVGQLTGGLAHDFNNLLAVINGSLELIVKRIAQGRMDDIGKFIAASQTAAQRATSLTHRLLAFSRRQTLDPRPIVIDRLVEGMRELINRTVGPEITIGIHKGDGLWTTLVDPPQLENALLNLCINARDAMPDGGQLTIETGNHKLDQAVAASREMQPGSYVSLSVSDTGTGMSPETIARAFEPFFTTKPIGQGTGLGLSMIYGFSQQSNGQVRIHSELGRGTTVTIYLPRSTDSAEAPDAAPPSEPQHVGRALKVLVVDDEPHVRMLVIDVLQDMGCEVLEAVDGQAGLKILLADRAIDLLITDVGMPGMNGRQLADAARVQRPDLKTLFITGYAETAVISHGYLDQGMAVLTKPFAVDTLVQRVKGLTDSET